MIMFLVALVCLLLSVLSTVDKYEQKATDILIELEILMVAWFSLEFVLRIWSAGCRSRYQNLQGRLQFLKRPLCLLDVVVIVASMTILCFRSEGRIFTTSALGGLRFFQILRMLRIDRRGGSWKLLGSVIWAHRQELFTTLYIGFLGLTFFSFLIYIVEKDKNPARFGTYPDALWWGVVTLCTVGYGDAVPVTWLGKLVASCCALLGISFFALPAGILGSGFALKVQQQQRQKHLTRRKGPAAVLIQSLWRCHAAEESFHSTATWLVHVHRLSPKSNAASTTGGSQKFRMNSSFISRLSIRRKEGYAGSHQLPGNAPATASGNNATSGQTEEGKASLVRRTYSGNAEPSSRYALLNSRSKLKRSHISFQDVMGLQNSTMVDTSVKKDPENDLKSGDSNEDVLHFARVDHLTPTHKTAIRAIRKIKFFVARRIFKEALKPYDVKDVIEQYTAGHLDMLTRVKDLQTRLDLIIGHSGSASPEMSESRVSMAARIVKIEKQVSCIESKLDSLVEMQRSLRGGGGRGGGGGGRGGGEGEASGSLGGGERGTRGSSGHARTDSIPSTHSSECNDGRPSTYDPDRKYLQQQQQQQLSHEKAYKQLSEPLKSSSDSTRKDHHHHRRHQHHDHHHHHHHHPHHRHLPPHRHLNAGQYGARDFADSDRSLAGPFDSDRFGSWLGGDAALLVAYGGSSEVARSEVALDRRERYDSESEESRRPDASCDCDCAENGHGGSTTPEINAVALLLPTGAEERDDVANDRKTLYTLSERTSVSNSTGWSNSASTSVESEVKAGQKGGGGEEGGGSRDDYKVLEAAERREKDEEEEDEEDRDEEGVRSARFPLADPDRFTPDAAESSEYEPLLCPSDVGDSADYVSCHVNRNRCSRIRGGDDDDGDDSRSYNGGSHRTRDKMAAVPLLDPLFLLDTRPTATTISTAAGSGSGQCPSIFLTMPSNERISCCVGVPDAPFGEPRSSQSNPLPHLPLHHSPHSHPRGSGVKEKCLTTISRSVSDVCSFDELL